jgi:protein gp37
MAQNSKIEWTHHTFNPWRGCTKVSEGCKNCYAETMSKRNPAVLGIWGDDGARVVAKEAYWRLPLKWNKAVFDDAPLYGEKKRLRVFCSSLADVFEDRPELVEPRRRLFGLINETPDLDWLLLTKRPENIERLFDDVQRHWGWDEDLSVMNVWLGTSVENQEQADKRIPELLKIPATVRFLSCEPLLGPVDLTQVSLTNHIREGLRKACGDDAANSITADIARLNALTGEWFDGWDSGIDRKIDWVIAGGESGSNARPMHPGWARSLRDQCQAARVPFFFKQWGEFAPYVGSPGQTWPPTVQTVTPSGIPLAVDGYVHGQAKMNRVGKKAAGRLLDGCEWNEIPKGGENVKN